MAGKRGTRTKDATPDILRRISEGESLRKACAANGLTIRSFLDLCDRDQEIATQYTRAREAGLEVLADQLVDLCDTPVEGTETTVKADGGVEVKTGDMLGHRKLQIDTRKWLLSKLLPKKYGDKVDLNHAGKDGGPLEFLVRVDRDPGT